MKAVALDNQKQQGSLQSTAGELHFAGDLIDGKYRLERELGAGAMGRVWLARNAHLDLPVAIKIVDVQQHGRDAMSRVLTEARLLAQLSHPNIVRVLDCHSDEGSAYVVMELLEGCTLAELMEEGPLGATLVARLAVPLLDALATAHRAGIIHRDIKPDNIFVVRRGNRICPKLLDFGIARSGSVQVTRKDKRLIVGTPGYMSPEQAMGEDAVDERADIWAMGVVMYEAISGESAFQSTTYTNYLRALRERQLTPLESEGTAGLWQVLSRAMSRAKDERFASASELAATLRLWLRARGLREDLQGDSLPEHWAVQGSLVQRAFDRAARRELASRVESGRRPMLPGSADTLVDPRVVPESQEKSGVATFKSERRRAAPKRPLVMWAAAASVLCATLAILHARADAGPSPQSKARRPGPQAHAPERAQLSAADLRQLAVVSHEPAPTPSVAASEVVAPPPTADELPRSEAPVPSKSGVRRIAKRNTHAAHSGMVETAQAARVLEKHRDGARSLDQMRLW